MSEIQKFFGDTYAILDEIGSGGGGTVYKAYHQRLKKEVALKKIHSDLVDVNTRMETDILKNIRHSYLPQVIDFLEMPDGVYTVMDFIDGVSLAQVLQKNQWVPEKEVIKWFKQLCQALEVLHNQPKPVIHGDIKPANIMLTKSGDICLIDFNIASIYEGSKTIISGYTPGYAAPEQIEFIHRNANREATEAIQNNGETFVEGGNNPDTLVSAHSDNTSIMDDFNELQTIIDVRTDIYNLGATMFHLLTGQRPVTKDRVYYAVEELNPYISATLCHIVNKCIAPDRRDRYQSISDVLKALNNMYLSDERYVKLIREQRVLRVLLIIGTIVFSGVAAFGAVLMKRDNSAGYAKMINVETRAVEAFDEEALDEAFEKAVDMDRSNPEAYEIKAQFLYDTHRYDECLNFIEDIALPEINNGEGNSSLKYIIASCYMAKEDYRTAIDYVVEAIEMDPENGVLYSDYAVCAAKLGDTKVAEKQLDKAIKKGLEEAAISYTKGEILLEKGKLDEAKDCFKDALKKTDDEHTKLRSYVALIDICREENTESSLNKAVEYCDKAIENLDKALLLTINEKKAQVLVDLGAMTDNYDYFDQAVEMFNIIIDDGFGTFKTHISLVNIYQKSRQYDKEEKELNNMLDLYGEDYRIYMNFAYMEVAIQNDIEDSLSRDYKKFETYYLKAEELYENAGTDDAEMLHLRELYEQAKEYGWLDK